MDERTLVLLKMKELLDWLDTRIEIADKIEQPRKVSRMSITVEEKRDWLENYVSKRLVYPHDKKLIEAILADIEWRGRMEKRIEILRKYAKEIGKVEGIVIHSKKGREQIGKLMALADTIRDLDLEKP